MNSEPRVTDDVLCELVSGHPTHPVPLPSPHPALSHPSMTPPAGRYTHYWRQGSKLKGHTQGSQSQAIDWNRLSEEGASNGIDHTGPFQEYTKRRVSSLVAAQFRLEFMGPPPDFLSLDKKAGVEVEKLGRSILIPRSRPKVNSQRGGTVDGIYYKAVGREHRWAKHINVTLETYI